MSLLGDFKTSGNSAKGAPQAGVEDILTSARARAAVWGDSSLSERLLVVRKFRHNLALTAREAATQIAATDRPAVEVITSEILPLLSACRFLEKHSGRILKPQKFGVRGRPVWLWGSSSTVARTPHGVVMIVAPSNYPLFLPGVQMLQALVAGNAVILKPGLGGESAARLLVRLLNQSGLPHGVVQCLPEHPEVARAILERGVDKLFFTGSAAVGTEILAGIASKPIPAVMELSGSDAAIVRADAHVQLAAKSLAFGMRLNAGRTCIAPRRVIVASSIASELEGRLAEELRQCPPVELPASVCKSLVPLVSDALSAGAHLLCGELDFEKRHLVGPLVLAGIQQGSPILREDVFGPVMFLLTVMDDDQAVAAANDGEFGLGASIFTGSKQKAADIASRLNTGTVVINDLIVPTADPRLPFGGKGRSGFGSTRGAEGLLEMTRPKVTIVRRGSSRPHLRKVGRDHEGLFSDFTALCYASGLAARAKALVNLIAGATQRR